jgi:hypothetical protein
MIPKWKLALKLFLYFIAFLVAICAYAELDILFGAEKKLPEPPTYEHATHTGCQITVYREGYIQVNLSVEYSDRPKWEKLVQDLPKQKDDDAASDLGYEVCKEWRAISKPKIQPQVARK